MYKCLQTVLEKYASYDPLQVEKICSKVQKKNFKKNDFLLVPGNRCHHMYFVNRGCLRFFGLNQDGTELTRYLGFSNKFSTNLTSFINASPSEEYIQAVIDTEVLIFGKKDFYELEEESPLFKSVYKNILEQAYITSQQRIYSFQGKSAKERLEHLLFQEPKILSEIPHKIIASFLGITPYTFSRLLKKENWNKN